MRRRNGQTNGRSPHPDEGLMNISQLSHCQIIASHVHDFWLGATDGTWRGKSTVEHRGHPYICLFFRLSSPHAPQGLAQDSKRLASASLKLPQAFQRLPQASHRLARVSHKLQVSSEEYRFYGDVMIVFLMISIKQVLNPLSPILNQKPGFFCLHKKKLVRSY